jgi:hypothetical protein
MGSKRSSTKLISASLIALVTVLGSCYYDKSESLYGVTKCDTTNVGYSNVISPIIQRDCAGCHSGSGASAGIQLYDYTSVKNYMSSNKMRLLGSVKWDGTASNMPKGGNKWSNCNINSMQAWVNQGMKP